MEDQCSGPFTDAKDCPVHGRNLPERQLAVLRARLRDLRDQWQHRNERDNLTAGECIEELETALLVDPLTRQQEE